MADEAHVTSNGTGGPGFTPEVTAGLTAFDENAAVFEREHESISSRYGVIRWLGDTPETLVFAENDGILALIDQYGIAAVFDTIIAEYTERPEALDPHSLLVRFIPDASGREAFYESATRRVATQTYPESWHAAYVQHHATEALRELDTPSANGRWNHKNAAQELGALLTNPVSGPMLQEVFAYAHAGTGTVDVMRLANGWEELYATLKQDFAADVHQVDINPQITKLMDELALLEVQTLAPIRSGVDALNRDVQLITALPETRVRLETVLEQAEVEYAATAATLRQAIETRRTRARTAGEALARFVGLLEMQL